MHHQDFESGDSPKVEIQEIFGDITIRGEERARVSINAEPDEVQVEQNQECIRMNCQGDCDLRVPQSSTLEIQRAHGDIFIKSVLGECLVQEALACVTMRTVNAAKIGVIHGDLSIKGVEANLHVTRVLGNAAVRDLAGDCLLEEVHGNLELRYVKGKIQAHAYGNLYARLDDLPPGEHHLHAMGDLYCRVPEEVNIRFNLSSLGETIFLRTPEESKALQQSHFSLNLGEASAVVNLTAGGNLYLYVTRLEEAEPDEAFRSLPEDFGQQIINQVEAQIGAQMEAVSRQINEQMSHLAEHLMQAGVSRARAEEVIERARQTNERETQRAQERIRRAQEKLERKLEAARRKRELRIKAFERRAAGRRAEPAFQSAPSTSSAEPALEEERLFILRMLREKKITVEEANKLLDALESKSE